MQAGEGSNSGDDTSDLRARPRQDSGRAPAVQASAPNLAFLPSFSRLSSRQSSRQGDDAVDFLDLSSDGYVQDAASEFTDDVASSCTEHIQGTITDLPKTQMYSSQGPTELGHGPKIMPYAQARMLSDGRVVSPGGSIGPRIEPYASARPAVSSRPRERGTQRRGSDASETSTGSFSYPAQRPPVASRSSQPPSTAAASQPEYQPPPMQYQSPPQYQSPTQQYGTASPYQHVRPVQTGVPLMERPAGVSPSAPLASAVSMAPTEQRGRLPLRGPDIPDVSRSGMSRGGSADAGPGATRIPTQGTTLIPRSLPDSQHTGVYAASAAYPPQAMAAMAAAATERRMAAAAPADRRPAAAAGDMSAPRLNTNEPPPVAPTTRPRAAPLHERAGMESFGGAASPPAAANSAARVPPQREMGVGSSRDSPRGASAGPGSPTGSPRPVPPRGSPGPRSGPGVVVSPRGGEFVERWVDRDGVYAPPIPPRSWNGAVPGSPVSPPPTIPSRVRNTPRTPDRLAEAQAMAAMEGTQPPQPPSPASGAERYGREQFAREPSFPDTAAFSPRAGNVIYVDKVPTSLSADSRYAVGVGGGEQRGGADGIGGGGFTGRPMSPPPTGGRPMSPQPPTSRPMSPQPPTMSPPASIALSTNRPMSPPVRPMSPQPPAQSPPAPPGAVRSAASPVTSSPYGSAPWVPVTASPSLSPDSRVGYGPGRSMATLQPQYAPVPTEQRRDFGASAVTSLSPRSMTSDADRTRLYAPRENGMNGAYFEASETRQALDYFRGGQPAGVLMPTTVRQIMSYENGLPPVDEPDDSVPAFIKQYDEQQQRERELMTSRAPARRRSSVDERKRSPPVADEGVVRTSRERRRSSQGGGSERARSRTPRSPRKRGGSRGADQDTTCWSDSTSEGPDPRDRAPFDELSDDSDEDKHAKLELEMHGFKRALHYLKAHGAAPDVVDKIKTRYAVLRRSVKEKDARKREQEDRKDNALGPLRKVIALYPTEAEVPNELPLKTGDILLVNAESGNWYHGANNRGQVGFFPKNFVRPYELEDTPDFSHQKAVVRVILNDTGDGIVKRKAMKFAPSEFVHDVKRQIAQKFEVKAAAYELRAENGVVLADGATLGAHQNGILPTILHLHPKWKTPHLFGAAK